MSVNFNNPEYLDLKARIRENPKDFVAIVGAGLSIPAGLPDRQKLKQSILDDAIERISSLSQEEQEEPLKELETISNISDYWQFFSRIKEVLGKSAYEGSIKKYLTTRGKYTIPRSYELLWALNIKGMVNFNIDTFALDAFSEIKHYAVDTATQMEVSRYKQFIPGDQDFILHPHGIVNNSDTWVFTEEEKSKLLANGDYLKFTDTLFRAKNTIILGFNPDDFSFKYLLQHACYQDSSIGSTHYIFIANANIGTIKAQGNQNIKVIPYIPEDEIQHSEIIDLLQDILGYDPRDIEASSVYSGAIISPEQLPSDEELSTQSVEQIRNQLNGAILSILAPDKEVSQDDYNTLSDLYKEYLFSLNKAWIVEPNSKSDILYDYTVTKSVGRGAFGIVFDSINNENGERAAVKVLLPDVRTDQDYLRSFRRGIRSMRILTDKAVEGMVKFFKAFEVPACVFMEYIEGPNLEEAIDDRIVTELTDRLNILVQVGEIVHRAHNLEERVLHRDLKPANVILKDYYVLDEIQVTVLDFDLSWHKGASDLSVVHGARSQGYAAPEQTATGRFSGYSTRNTAVDVFGYGMIAFFVFSGRDPRPNEQNFDNFVNDLKSKILEQFRSEWLHLPDYLANVVGNCVKDDQGSRIPLQSAIEAFKTSYELLINNQVKAYQPNLLLELATRISIDENYQVEDFGRHIHVSNQAAKSVDLFLKNDTLGQIYVEINFLRVTTEYDHRYVNQRIRSAQEKVRSELSKNHLLREINCKEGRGTLHVCARWYVEEDVNITEIQKITEIVISARSVLEF